MTRASSRVRRFGHQLESVGKTFTYGVTAPLLGVGVAAVKMASDAVESESLFAVAMGGMADKARAFSEGLRAQLGLNSFELRKNIATFYQMFTGMDLGTAASYQMATGLTQLANDMASFRNMKPEEAFDKLRSGIVGESKPLKDLGILVDDTTAKAEALRLGIIKPGQEMSQQQKVIARYAAILRQTGNDQGHLARTLDSPTNQLRIQGQAIKQVAIELGTSLLPAYQKLLLFTRSLITRIQQAVAWWRALSAGQRATIITLTALAAAIGPLLIGMAKVAALLAALPRLLALVTSTAGATVAIVAILAFAAVTFVKNWDVVKIQFLSLWTAMKDGVLRAVSFILGALGHLPFVGKMFRDLKADLDAFAEESLANAGRKLAGLEQDLVASGGAARAAAPDIDQFKLALGDLTATAAGFGATSVAEKIKTIQADLRKALGEAGAGFQLFDATAIETMTAQLNAYRDAATKLIAEGLSPQSAAVQQLLGQYNLLAAQIADANAQQERMNGLLQAAAQVQAETQTPLEAYVQRVRLLTTLLGEGLIKQQQFEAAVRQAMATYQDAVAPTMKLGEALQQTLGSALENAANVIGTFLVNLRGGFKSFLGGIVGIIGQIMQQLGRALIAFGIAGIAIKKFITNPVAALVAGAALVALGGALAGAAQKIVDTGGAAIAGGGGYGGGSAAVSPTGGGYSGMATGPTIIELPPGRRIYDWSDPAQVKDFQDFWDQLVGRRVIFVPTA